MEVAAMWKKIAPSHEAELRAEAAKIEFEAEQAQLAMKRAVDLKHRREQNALEVSKAEEEAAIETEKFKQTVQAITPETIAKIATAGPEAQAKLLAGLGLKGFVVTDGSSPINLFNTASGMVNTPAAAS